MVNNQLVALGSAIEGSRIEKRLTYAEVGRRAGIQRSHLSRIERGLVNPRLSTLQAIADALEVTLTALCVAAELPPPNSDKESAMSETPVEHPDAGPVAEADSREQARTQAAALFAEQVASVRRAKRLGQSEVSSRSGIHVSEISRIEHGLRDPRLSTLILLAYALEVEPAMLLDRIEEDGSEFPVRCDRTDGKQ
jgi:transcriptional regulator with XRE-family HTH domain